MALRIRMQRQGNTHRPFDHLVVTESRNARNGSFLEKLGFYDPTKEPSVIEVDHERIQHWYAVGARPSDAVANLLRVKKLPFSK